MKCKVIINGIACGDTFSQRVNEALENGWELNGPPLADVGYLIQPLIKRGPDLEQEKGK